MDRLRTTLTITLHLLTALLLSLLALPIFLLWRISLLPLMLLPSTSTSTSTATTRSTTRAHTTFHLTWQRFLKLPSIALATKFRARITAACLLLLCTGLAFTAFVRSSMLFVPFLLSPHHYPTSTSDSTSSPISAHANHRNDILLHTALYLATCAPLCFVSGVAAALCYYARKYWKYGKFEKKMRRKPGGRGYWVDPGDAAGGKNKGHQHQGVLIGGGRKEEVVGKKGGGHVDVDIMSGEKEKELQIEEKMGAEDGEERRWDQVDLYGGISGKEGGEFVKRPEIAVTMPTETATARFERNQFTRAGASSIWSSSSSSLAKKVADKFKSGYDGRKVRRQAWEDLEMSEGVARK